MEFTLFHINWAVVTIIVDLHFEIILLKVELQDALLSRRLKGKEMS